MPCVPVLTLRLSNYNMMSPVHPLMLLLGCHHRRPSARAAFELHTCHLVSYARCITTNAWGASMLKKEEGLL